MNSLNELAYEICEHMVGDANRLGIEVCTLNCGTRIIDCGVKAPGSMEAGVQLARVCISGMGLVTVRPNPDSDMPAQHMVNVSTRSPVAACMASQYAGWELKSDKFFAMGSGPMRAAACREELFKDIGCSEKPDVCVGVLETSKLPPDALCVDVAEKCGISPNRLTLCVARTSSQAGTLQIVARSVETALHKLHVLGFDLGRIERAEGRAPLPPRTDDDLQAIGWTNDAILYGAGVVLEVFGDDSSIEQIGPRVPSNASPDHGRPFAEVFARYDHNFYRIDPLLFSPAVVIISNADTGSLYKYGNLALDVLAESFAKK
jgi:methenyltetrahydromethanopterin cyclohydrolase